MQPKTRALFALLAIFIAVFIVLDFNYLWFQLESIFKINTETTINSQQPPQTKLSEPNLLQIESLGLEAPVVYVDQANEKVFQAALINGVVHYPGTALPGQLGNCYIFGHSSDFIWSKGKYKTIFAPLTKIKIGDIIKISDNLGYVFVYQVTKTIVVSPSDTSVLNQGNRDKKLLTLQTSWPVGTALKRWVAVAEMK